MVRGGVNLWSFVMLAQSPTGGTGYDTYDTQNGSEAAYLGLGTKMIVYALELVHAIIMVYLNCTES